MFPRAPLSVRTALLSLLVVACDGEKGPADETSPPPTVALTAPADGATFDEGTAVTFAADVVDDAAPGDLAVTWTSDVDGVLDTTPADAAGTASFSTSALTPGDHVVTVRVVDVDAQAAEDSVTITVLAVDDAPQIDVVSPTSGDVAVQGVPFELAVDVSDAEDAPADLAVSFTSDIDAALCAPTPDEQGRASCSVSLTQGDHVLTFAVVDSAGHEATAEATLQVAAPGDPDEDEDGYTATEGDCDDGDPEIGPFADEACDGVDNDCDDATDEDDAVDAVIWYRDADADGYGDAGDATSACAVPAGYVDDASDCDDTDPARSPETLWYRDADGDGYGDPDSSLAQCAAPAGHVPDATDCDDGSAAASPAGAEACDGEDNDCDGTADEEGASGCTDRYEDVDGDGYGGAGTVPVCTCEAAGAYTATNADDCYDGNADASPAATAYASTDRGDGSYDYDCDGVESQEALDVYECVGSLFECTSNVDGWMGAIPACGATRTWGVGCTADETSCTPETTTSRTQACL